MTDLMALADRCEREEPSRELNMEILLAVWEVGSVGNHNMRQRLIRWQQDGRDPVLLSGVGYDPRYTTSLDAAVTLVPEGWQSTDLCWDKGVCRYGLFTPQGWHHAYANAKTEPMARCAAALRARAALQAKATS